MKPIGVVTDQGHFVASDVLDSYAIKESRQLQTPPKFEQHKGLIAPKYDPMHLSSLLELNTAHLVACRQKSEDVLGRGWEFVQTAGDASVNDRDRLKAWFDEVPPPESALDSQTHRSVFAAAQFDFEAIGRGAIELVRRDRAANGPLETIVHAPAHTLRLHRDGVRFVQHKGSRSRWFKWAGASIDVDYETGETTDLGEMDAERRANEIVWWKNYHPSDPVYGLPDIIPAVGAVHGDLGRRNYNLEFFNNYGVPAYAIFVTGDFDQGDFVDKDGEPVDESDPAGKFEMEWHIQSLLKEVRENPHSSLVFTIPTREGMADGEVKIEFKPLSTEVKEASFRAYRRDNREEVLSSHRMSAAIAGVYDAGAANREARGQYKQSVVWPRRTLLEALVNHFIVGAFGVTGWRWTLKSLDDREADHKVEQAGKALDHGAITRREYRRIVAPVLGIDPDAPDDVDDAELDQFGVGDTGRERDDVGPALMSLRDELVDVAIKAQTNGKGGALDPALLVGGRR